MPEHTFEDTLREVHAVTLGDELWCGDYECRFCKNAGTIGYRVDDTQAIVNFVTDLSSEERVMLMQIAQEATWRNYETGKKLQETYEFPDSSRNETMKQLHFKISVLMGEHKGFE